MWVARDKNGEVQLFTATKPHRVKRLGEEYWDTDGLCDCECYIPDIFPNLKWEDEPVEVEIIKKKSVSDTEVLDMLDEMGYGNEIAEAIERCKEISYVGSKR